MQEIYWGNTSERGKMGRNLEVSGRVRPRCRCNHLGGERERRKVGQKKAVGYSAVPRRFQQSQCGTLEPKPSIEGASCLPDIDLSNFAVLRPRLGVSGDGFRSQLLGG